MRIRIVSLLALLAVCVLAAMPQANARAALSGNLEQRLETLIVKDQIRETLNSYSLLLDGFDGARDQTAWAERFFTPDAVLRTYLWDGAIANEVKGRDAILEQAAKIALDNGRPGPMRHYMINTVFDEISPTRVTTRSVAANIKGTRIREMISPAPIEGISIVVYRGKWILEKGIWKMTLLELHYDTGPSMEALPSTMRP